jgi:c-di-GMP-binding flagellar brake protein YcgR
VRTLRAPPGEPAPRLVGLRFDQLAPSQQQRLQRYVQRRDRELLRDTRL